jgi:Holliday junction resolvasome RuvABC ATP-dependent DNA helicase subunit
MMEHNQHALILGKTSVGKTTMINSMSKVLSAKLHIVNPVGLPSGFLLGIDEAMSFNKGILESLLQFSETASLKWILFDGPCDTWTESVSGLLDIETGGALCISSGKRIFLDKNTTVHIILYQ